MRVSSANMVAVLLVAVVTTANAGNTCRWLGGSGMWTDEACWENGLKPVSGNEDQIYITNGTVGAEITIPDAVVVGNMFISGSQSVHLKGAKLSFKDSLRIDRHVTIDNAMEFLSNNSCLTPGHAVDAGGTSVFNGPVTFASTAGWVYIGGKSAAVFNSTVTGLSTLMRVSAVQLAEGTVTFNGAVKVKELNYNGTYGRCRFDFCATGNEWSIANLTFANIGFGCANAMPPESVISWGTYYRDNESSSSYRLNGYSQIANRISSVSPGVKNVDYISTTNDASLLLIGTDNAETYCCTRGKLTIIWSPVGDFTQAFLDRSHLTTGSLVVSNGTLRVGGTATFASVPRVEVAGGRFLIDSTSAGALAAVREVVVASNGVFEIDSQAEPFTAGTVSLSLAAGASFKVPSGKTLRVAALVIDGHAVSPDHAYGAGDLAELPGEGSVFVVDQALPAVAGRWTAGGGADTSVANGSNWGGTVPALTDGSLVATFADNGQEALVTGTCYWKGIAFAGNAANGFTVGADSGGALMLRELGISQTAYLTNTVTTPLVLNADQQWNLEAGSLLNISGGITSAFNGMTLAKSGNGTLALYGENDLKGDLLVSNGTIIVYGATNCLGKASDEGEVFVRQNGGDATVRFEGSGLVERKIRVAGKFGEGGLRQGAGVTNTFTKLVEANGDARFAFGAGSQAIFAGGFRIIGSTYAPTGIQTEQIHRNVPGSWNIFYLSNPLVRLQVPGNVAQRFEIREYGRLWVETDEVFSGRPTINMYAGSQNCLDLKGHDIEVGSVDACLGGTICSFEAPAVFSFVQGSAVTNSAVKFEGYLSVKKAGTGLFAFASTIAATGEVEVAEGTCAFVEAARWPGCTGAKVRSGATLLIDAAMRVFPQKIALEVDSGGKVDLGEGMRIRCSSLKIAGETMKAGGSVYGGPDSAAPNKKDCFAGTGTVVVFGPTTAISFR